MMNRLARSRRGIAILAVVALATFIGRVIWANGVFSSVPTGFLGSCKVAAAVPGVEDIEIANGLIFVSVGSERGPDARDGIYLLSDAGKLTRLSGTPADFHPRGIGIFRSPDGTGIFLMAVNHRNGASAGAGATHKNGASAQAGATHKKDRFSIDSFEVINAKTQPALVAQGTIEGGLLTDPQDVAAAGPGAFYVSNDSAKQNLVKLLASWGVLAGSDILYFNGMSFRPVAEDVYGARGLLLTPGSNHLLVASLTTRSLRSFSRDIFTGNLTEADSLTLPAAPEKISLDSHGEVWAAGHANLPQWRDFAANPGKRVSSQIFRVSLVGGVPQQATQIYGDNGKQIAAAGIAASIGQRLLIGSSLDDKLLDCTTN
jgi:hypothetical protein